MSEIGHLDAAPAAEPATDAQRARVGRIVQAANDLLANGGEAELQMKDLAAQAGVSLATLYRYFPSKDLLLVALGRSRFERGLRRLTSGRPISGDTPGQRAAGVLLREFRAVQREPAAAAAFSRLVTTDSAELRDALTEIADLHEQMILVAATSGGAVLSDAAKRLVPLLRATFATGARSWLAGTRTGPEVRLDIALACHLLDLPDAEILARLAAARQSLRRG